MRPVKASYPPRRADVVMFGSVGKLPVTGDMPHVPVWFPLVLFNGFPPKRSKPSLKGFLLRSIGIGVCLSLQKGQGWFG